MHCFAVSGVRDHKAATPQVDGIKFPWAQKQDQPPSGLPLRYNTMPSTKAATVTEASPSPPPLPPGPIPSTSASASTSTYNQPIKSLGEGSDDEDEDEDEDEEGQGKDDEWDPSAERLPGSEKGKGKASAAATGVQAPREENAHPWQAVWSADKNGETDMHFPSSDTTKCRGCS